MQNKTKMPPSRIIGTIISIVLLLIAAMLCGKLGADVAIRRIENRDVYFDSEAQIYLSLLVPVLIAYYIGYLLQLIVHESGHLVFGLASGYGFASFRIGSFILLKGESGFKMKRFSLAGTGGQCIMTPPPMHDGKYPCALYNLGGCIMNLVVSTAAAVIYIISSRDTYFSMFMIEFAVMGFYVAVLNGVPLKLGMIDNDGTNALNLGKNPQCMRALWSHMMIYTYQAKGYRLRDIPEELFYEPTDDALHDPTVAGYATAVFQRYVDMGDNEKAIAYAHHILDTADGILPVHRIALKGELLYLELTGARDENVISSLADAEIKRYFRASKLSPSASRTAYAYALYSGDKKHADKYAAQFESILNKYPFDGEIALERELFAKTRSITAQTEPLS